MGQNCYYTCNQKVPYLTCLELLSQELIEQLGKGDLPKDDYECMNTATSSNNSSSGGSNSKVPPTKPGQTAPHSMRSRRTAAWAKSRTSDDGYSRQFSSGKLKINYKLQF